MDQLSSIIVLFLLYSIMGWLWETVYCSLKAKKFEYRGFLLGPYCPIYGFGVLAVLYFLHPFEDNLLVLYVSSTVIVTVLEYGTSYVLEKLFHATWWDYHTVPLNLNGRIALPVSLFWGMGCVIIVTMIQPKMMLFEQWLTTRLGLMAPLFVLILMGADMVFTLSSMFAFRKIVEEAREILDKTKADIAKDIKMKRTTYMETLKAERTLPTLSFTHRRHLKNYRHITLTTVKNSDELKQFMTRYFN